MAGGVSRRDFRLGAALPARDHRKIEEAPRNPYSLGFSPKGARDERFHQLVLSTRRKGLAVQTRSEYYGKTS